MEILIRAADLDSVGWSRSVFVGVSVFKKLPTPTKENRSEQISKPTLT